LVFVDEKIGRLNCKKLIKKVIFLNNNLLIVDKTIDTNLHLLTIYNNRTKDQQI